MASEETGETDVSLAVPAEVGEWLDAEAKRRGTDRETLCRRLLAAGRVAADDDSLEPVDRESLEDLRARVDAQREEFVELVEDVRKRVIQVKRETDAKAPADHDHEDLASADDIESIRADLEAVATDLENAAVGREAQQRDPAAIPADVEGAEPDLEGAETDLEGVAADLAALTSTVDAGFDNFEEICEYLLAETDDLADRTTMLATAVVGLREARDALVGRDRRRARAEELQLAANRLGVRTAACDACDASVDLALLTAPECPHCASPIADVESKTSLFGSHRLVTGEPPALDGRVDDRVEAPFDGDEREEIFDDVASEMGRDSDGAHESGAPPESDGTDASGRPEVSR